MSEMAMTADQLVVVGRGRLIAETSVAEFTAGASTGGVLVRSPHAARLAEALRGPGITVTPKDADTLELTGLTAPAVGEAALAAGIVLHELTPQQASLEEAFMHLTADAVEYTGHAPASIGGQQ